MFQTTNQYISLYQTCDYQFAFRRNASTWGVQVLKTDSLAPCDHTLKHQIPGFRLVGLIHFLIFRLNITGWWFQTL